VTVVLVVDDEALVGIGLKMILEGTGEFSVITSGGPDARSLAEQHRPAVVLLDVQMARLDGMAVLSDLRTLMPPPPLAMLTTLGARDYVLDSLRGGACGFLFKDSQPDELMAAVRALAAGSTVLAPMATSIILRDISRGRSSATVLASSRVDLLSDREQAVLRLLGSGLTNGEISRRLFLSNATVKDHVSSILVKLGVNNRVQAAVLAYEAGLVMTDVAAS